jgi:hypothetical protein
MKAWITIDGAEKPIAVDYQKIIHIDFNPADPNRRMKPTEWVHPEGIVEIEWDLAGYCIGINVKADESVLPK